jgi:hypothetical protein
MRLITSLVALAAVCGAFASAPDAAAGGHRTYEDKQRGYRVSLDDKFVQVPPKLTRGNAYVVGDWYPDAAKYDGGIKPMFRILWFPTAAASPVTPAASDKSPDAPQQAPEADDDDFGPGGRPQSTDEASDRILQFRSDLFGTFQPTAERFSNAKLVKKTSTRCKAQAEYVEVNSGKFKHDSPIKAYAFVARLKLTRPDETIEVGFVGCCGVENSKKLSETFLDVVQSFEDLKTYTDSRNLGAEAELDENDPEKFREIIKKTKLIPGWVAYDTPHYLVVYPQKDVDPGLAKKLGDQIEAIRSQVYEVLFPPDKQVKAISVVRCCKDRDQYFAYGGPPGSAGYWASGEKELVFYEDDDKKNSLRVLYHEAFHQYIYYSVGDMAPHSWFNEGHGDYFAGFNYVGGKFVRDKFSWRADSKTIKKRDNLPPLWDWLHWSQGQYYGGNKGNLSIGDNYCLGWDFVYFLRTTKKKEYQGILDRYFQTLKGYVTRARNSREHPAVPVGDGSSGSGAPAGEGGAAQQPPAEPPKPAEIDPTLYNPQAWLDKALEAAFKGVDMKQLEKDWKDD